MSAQSQNQTPNQEPNQHFVLFNNYLVELLSIIKNGVQDGSKVISKCYQKYKKVDRQTYVDYTLTKLQPHMKHITQEDPFLFSPEYSSEPMKLLSGLDFKTFWEDLSEEHQSEVWKRLQYLYITGSFALGIGRKDPIVRGILDSMRAEKELQEEVQEEPDEDDAEATGAGGMLDPLGGMLGQLINPESCPDLGNMEELFNEDNVLVQLAKEVGEELSQSNLAETLGINPNEEVTNPLEAITKLFGQDAHKLESLVTTFGEKLQEKMQEKQIGEDALFKATTDIGQKFMGKFTGVEGMPDFSVLQNIDPEEMAKLTPEEQEAKRQEMMEQLTQNMTDEQRQQFGQINEMMQTNMEQMVAQQRAEGMHPHHHGHPLQGAQPHNASMQQPPQAFIRAWNQAKVRHLESIGGESIQDLEGEEGFTEIHTKQLTQAGIVPTDNFHYIHCVETIMRVPNKSWNEFMETCQDQMGEISKFMDYPVESDSISDQQVDQNHEQLEGTDEIEGESGGIVQVAPEGDVVLEEEGYQAEIENDEELDAELEDIKSNLSK